MAHVIMDHRVSGCFRTSWHHALALFTVLSRGKHFVHGTALSLSIWQIALCRYPLARVQAALELPEAIHFAFDRVAPIDPGSAHGPTQPSDDPGSAPVPNYPNYDQTTKMPQLGWEMI